MPSEKNLLRKLLASLPTETTQTIQSSDSFRFEALSLLDQAKARFSEIERKPPTDAAAVSGAALESLHLAIKALLAAKGFRSQSVTGSVELLKGLYRKEIPPKLIQQYLDIMSLRLQGVGARTALSSFIDASARLLTK